VSTRRDEEVLARVGLSRVIEPGDRAAMELVAGQGAVAAWGWVRSGGGPARWRVRLAEADPGRDLEVTERIGARVIVPGDEEWPSRLDDLGANRPLCLWLRGTVRLAAATASSVSVVGCRASSPYGAHVTRRLAAGCAEQGVTIVSGGAYGIDAFAHQAALAVEGTTVAVLACGIDRFYPRGHERLLRDVAAHGAVVTEVPPGGAPMRWRFLERNRLIAALTPLTVVVEAAWRSGALATANRATGLGRQVAAVPGPVTSATSAGCHALLRDGATCVTDAAEVLELLAPLGTVDAGHEDRGLPRDHDGLDECGLRVFDALPVGRAADVDSLSRVAGLDAPAVRAALARLEMSGHATFESGRWRRTPGRLGRG
jgi:DNA processing protein